MEIHTSLKPRHFSLNSGSSPPIQNAEYRAIHSIHLPPCICYRSCLPNSPSLYLTLPYCLTRQHCLSQCQFIWHPCQHSSNLTPLHFATLFCKRRVYCITVLLCVWTGAIGQTKRMRPDIPELFTGRRSHVWLRKGHVSIGLSKLCI